MKKVFATVIAVILALALAVSAVAEAPMLGGWTVYNDAETRVTEDAQQALDTTAQAKLGAGYKAIALLGTQVVNGTNYAILCSITPVVPDAQTAEYAIVYVNAALDGTATVLEIKSLSEVQDTLGSDTVYSGEEAVPAEALAALNKALETLVGAQYQAVALTATQLVSGTNYKLVCAVTPVVPDAPTTYAMVTVYQALDGTCSITEVTPIELGLTQE